MISKARSETSGVLSTIHFNNAGSSLPPDCVLSAVIDYLKCEASIGGYEAEMRFENQFKNIYHSIARLINAKATEIAIVESATRAWNLALSSIPFKKGDKVLTTHGEYISNYLALLQLKEKIGIEVILLPNNAQGEFSREALVAALDERVKLVCITHIPSTNGMINPLNGLSEIIHSCGALYLLDACQSVGQQVIDVAEIGCDFLAATGRKFLRAPRGSGFLYIKESLLKTHTPLFLDFLSASLNADASGFSALTSAKRFENFEMSYASRIGLGAACDYALNLTMPLISEQVSSIANELRRELAHIPKVILRDSGVNKSGIVTFTLDGISPLAFSNLMRAKKINVSTAVQQFSLDLRERKIESVIRASLHYYNSSEEIQKFLEELKQLIK